MFEDSFIHKGQRKQLVDYLAQKGIQDVNVLQAINNVPRHIFFDKALESHAYEDKAFPIRAGQTISQPYTVAFQSELLQIKKGDKVLEIGTGSGYQASVLFKMGAKVFSIERQKELYFDTKTKLIKQGYAIDMFLGDGFKGLPNFAPFDKIIITAAAPYLPRTLLDQLKVGGKLVIPVGQGKTQKMHLITKVNEKDFEQESHGEFSFVPMLKGIQN